MEIFTFVLWVVLSLIASIVCLYFAFVILFKYKSNVPGIIVGIVTIIVIIAMMTGVVHLGERFGLSVTDEVECCCPCCEQKVGE